MRSALGDYAYMTEKSGLTICTVSFNSAEHLDLNYRLTDSLNPSVPVRWVVAENSSPSFRLDMYPEHERFQIVDGATFQGDLYAAASHHHATALNKILPLVQSRFVLILDPDFYIVRSNWIEEITEYMVINKLSFFGAPWHPSGFKKWRYFPCVHCMFIDLERVRRETLDFLPDYPDVPGYKRGKVKSSQTMYDKFLWLILDPLKFRRRRHVGTSRDTSWRIYNRYHSDLAHKSECLQAVHDNTSNNLQSYASYVLPERYSLVPKKKGYFVAEGFKEHGLIDMRAMGCEEFMWKNRPFGFHIRSHPKRSKGQSFNQQLEAVGRLVVSLQQETGST